ncbi:uncharacterized protein LOC142339589 isoform X2 [Convolutriloba macropyga]|uniref:uncharacterized protein LOC142339589 isoform X2 n=1 Tax=Convolutriloba macropyga TaxID=536237 RepID=UPI003F528B20
MLDDCDSDEREGFFSSENSGSHVSIKSATTAGARVKNTKSKSLPYPSLGPFVASGVPAATDSTDDDLDEKTKALKKKNKLFRNFSKTGSKDGKKKEKLFHKRKSSKNEEGSLTGLFGFPLSLVTDKTRLSDGIPLPQIVRDCLDAVERRGLEVPGIYTNEVAKGKIEVLKEQYEHLRVKPGSLVTVTDINEVACLLKTFLIELPDPVFSSSIAAVEISDDKNGLNNLTKYLNKQPNENRFLFQWILSHFANVLSNSKQNGVSVSDIVQILSTTFRIHSTQFLTNLLSCPSIMSSLHVHNLKYPDALFGGTQNAAADVGSSDDLNRVSGNVGGAKLNNACGLSPPDSPSTLKKDLLLYEDLLANLHSKMEDPLADKLRALKCSQGDDKISVNSGASTNKEQQPASDAIPANITSDRSSISPSQSIEPSSKTIQEFKLKQDDSAGHRSFSPAEEDQTDKSQNIIRSNTSPTVSGDADVWREFFTASEREMKEQLMSEIVNMRQVIAMLESQKAQLVNQVAHELGTTVEFKMKGTELMTDEEKEELAKNQADTEAIFRRMVEEVEVLTRKQADIKFLQWKTNNLHLSPETSVSSQPQNKTDQVAAF